VPIAPCVELTHPTVMLAAEFWPHGYLPMQGVSRTMYMMRDTLKERMTPMSMRFRHSVLGRKPSNDGSNNGDDGAAGAAALAVPPRAATTSVSGGAQEWAVQGSADVLPERLKRGPRALRDKQIKMSDGSSFSYGALHSVIRQGLVTGSITAASGKSFTGRAGSITGQLRAGSVTGAIRLASVTEVAGRTKSVAGPRTVRFAGSASGAAVQGNTLLPSGGSSTLVAAEAGMSARVSAAGHSAAARPSAPGTAVEGGATAGGFVLTPTGLVDPATGQAPELMVGPRRPSAFMRRPTRLAAGTGAHSLTLQFRMHCSSCCQLPPGAWLATSSNCVLESTRLALLS
jgi:hypothetical protein